jgi:fatty acid desaturase
MVDRTLMNALSPPRPAALWHLHATDAAGARFVVASGALTTAGVWLSLNDALALWAIGQILLGLAMVEWFVLLHECGHHTLFRTRGWNTAAGHAAGFFALIPFGVWTHVHRLHHKWTGWQDLDPTTATLAPRDRGRVERGVVRFCWKFWVPMFATVYRAGTFWNPVRVARYAAESRRAPQLIAGFASVLAMYAVLGVWLGPVMLMRCAGLATLIAFVLEDLLILSQHTHVPMDVSGGGRVAPHAAMDQERFTRSLRLPRTISRAVLHFDAHELHHMYPFVPGYRLREIAYEPKNEIDWRRWVVAARRIPGDVLLFQNRRQTGFHL